jgi:hypothetical protein
MYQGFRLCVCICTRYLHARTHTHTHTYIQQQNHKTSTIAHTHAATIAPALGAACVRARMCAPTANVLYKQVELSYTHTSTQITATGNRYVRSHNHRYADMCVGRTLTQIWAEKARKKVPATLIWAGPNSGDPVASPHSNLFHGQTCWQTSHP